MATLEARVSELGEEVQQVQAARDDAAAARHLVAANHRDVSGIRTELRDFRRAAAGSFNAMRSDVADLRSDVAVLQSDVAVLKDDVADLRSETRKGFTEIRGQFDRTAAGQAQIVELLDTFIGQQDR